MRILSATLIILLFSFNSLASGRDLFLDAFRAYVEMRAAEEHLAHAPIEADLEVRKKEEDKWASALTQKRIEFFTMVKAEKAEYLPWQQTVIESVEKKRPTNTANETIVQYLNTHFPDARKFSALEWQTVQEWFGTVNQEAFLKYSHAMNEISDRKPALADKKPSLLLVKNPYARLFPKEKNNSDEIVAKELKKAGYEVKFLELSPFTHISELAQELYHRLSTWEEEPVVVVTLDRASAIFFYCLDLYPDLRNSENISAWLNVNGALYGDWEKKKGRAIASIEPTHSPEKLEQEARHDLAMLHKSSLRRPVPLGNGFPVVNLVSFDRKQMKIEEGLVPGASTVYITKGPVTSSTHRALENIDLVANKEN